MLTFDNKSVGVLGFGIEGRDAVNFLLRQNAIVTVYDESVESNFLADDLALYRQQGVTFIFGTFPAITTHQIIIRSPGVYDQHARIIEAEKAGVIITSAIDIFFERCPAKTIGVTGTKGKGTTTTLLCAMLRAAGKSASVGGNIGQPLLGLLDSLTPESYIVMELSSFQLARAAYSPRLAIVLMVTSEHLNYHQTEAAYVAAKSWIVRHQASTDIAIVNDDYPNSRQIAQQAGSQVYHVSMSHAVSRGCWVADGKILLVDAGAPEIIMPVDQIFLAGQHNWQNVCAAIMAAHVLGVTTSVIQEVVKTFRGLEHRLELVAEVGGVRYYDDSFATTPESTIAALLAFDQPKIIILGGSSKQSDFSELASTIKRVSKSIRAIIGIGVEWATIKAALGDSADQLTVIEGCTTMSEIIEQAQRLVQPGDVVLLSPACASFGMFKDYKDRGDQFKTCVLELIH